MQRLLILSALLFVAAPAAADTLVLFKNGKALRVKSATPEGKWLKCEFEDKSFISVPASGVLSVEQAALGGNAGDLRPNQVAVGSGGGYVPGPRGGEPSQAVEPPIEEDLSASLAEEEAALRNQPPVPGLATGGRTNFRGVPIPPGENPALQQGGIQQGFQPLNQANAPFQNRRLNEQRGNRSRISLPPNQQPPNPDE